MNILETQCVERGATMLDQRWPDWWREVNLARLDVASEDDCVLGQLGRDRALAGEQMLHVVRLQSEWDAAGQMGHGYGFFVGVIFPDLGLTVADIGRMGFDSGWCEGIRVTSFDGLTQAWVRAISERVVRDVERVVEESLT